MDLKFTVVGGACWTIDVDGKFKIGCDPVLAPTNTEYDFGFFKSKRVKPPIYNESTFTDVKIWLITHSHADHIDDIGVSKIKEESYVVSRGDCKKLLQQCKSNNITYLDWHEAKTIEIENYCIEIIAVPAFHGSNFASKILAGKVNGYLLSISDSVECKTIYITSDTVYDKKIAGLIKEHNIDVLIPNLGHVKSSMWGGPLTMNVTMLNKFVEELEPAYVLPVHIDGFSHYETTREEIGAFFEVLEIGQSTQLD